MSTEHATTAPTRAEAHRAVARSVVMRTTRDDSGRFVDDAREGLVVGALVRIAVVLHVVLADVIPSRSSVERQGRKVQAAIAASSKAGARLYETLHRIENVLVVAVDEDVELVVIVPLACHGRLRAR